MSGDYLGIEGYEPVWLRGLTQIHKAHADGLGRLVGRCLTRAWLLWDVDADAWFADAPVLLDFDGEQASSARRCPATPITGSPDPWPWAAPARLPA